MKIQDLIEKQQKIEEDILKKFEHGEYSIDNPMIIINPYGISPLTALILIKTDKEVAVELVVEDESKEMSLHQSFPKRNHHILPVYGLSANESRRVSIETSDGLTNTLDLFCEVSKEEMMLPGIDVVSSRIEDSDFYFMTPTTDHYPFALDSKGKIRWLITLNLNFDLHKLKDGNFIIGTESLVGDTYYPDGLYKISPLGKIIKKYNVPTGYHHDTYEMQNGDIVALSNKNSTETVEDGMVLIDSEIGKIKKTWDFSKILPHKVAGSGSYSSKDWCHANAVDVIEELDEVWISARHLDIIFCFEYDSGELKYIIGDPEGWESNDVEKYFFKPTQENFEWQYEQHAVTVINQNLLCFFDNGTNGSKNPQDYKKNRESYSRGIVLKIDRENKSFEQIFEYGKERGVEFFSPYISNFQYINQHHYLIHSGGIAYKDGITLEGLGIKHVEEPGITLQSITVEIVDNKVVKEIETDGQVYRCKKHSIY